MWMKKAGHGLSPVGPRPCSLPDRTTIREVARRWTAGAHRREPSPATVGVKRPRSVETEAYRPVVVARSVPAITNGPVIARSVPDMVPEQRPRTKEGPTEADSERRSPPNSTSPTVPFAASWSCASAIGMDTVHHAAQPAPGIRAVRPPLLECQEGDDGLRPPREEGKRPRRCARTRSTEMVFTDLA